MVNKVTVNPLSVRGAGDIVSPKTASDFDVYNSTIVSGSEDVGGATMTVYTVSYVNGTYFTVSSGSVVLISDNTFTVSAVLKLNSDDSVVSGATVTCTVNDDTVLSGTTDSTGTVSFTVDTVSGVGKYIVKLVYAGTESVGGAFKVTGLLAVDLDSLSLSLTGDKTIVGSGETVTLSALLTANLDGTDYPVDGFPVEIYQYNPELFKFNGVIGDWKAGKAGTSTAITISGDDVLLVSQNSDTVYLENSLPVDRNWSLEFDVTSMQYPLQPAIMIVYNPVTDNTIQLKNMSSTGHYQVSYIASNHCMQINLDGELFYQTNSLQSEGYYLGFNVFPGRMQLTDVKATISNDVDTWSNLDSRVVVSTTATGTTVAGTADSLYNMYANVQGNDSSELDFFGDTVVDFDVVTCPSSRSAYVQIHDGNEDHTNFRKNLYTDMGVRDGSHVRITITDGLVEVYVDGVKNENCTVQTAFTGPYRIGFRGYQLWSFKFTNFNIGGF